MTLQFETWLNEMKTYNNVQKVLKLYNSNIQVQDNTKKSKSSNQLTINAGLDFEGKLRPPRAVQKLGREVEEIDCLRH